MEDTVLGRILNSASPGAKGESPAQKVARRETALRLLKTEPEKFIAAIENTCAPREDLVQTLVGVEE